MPAFSPAEIHSLFVRAFNAGDVEALAALYEPDAVLVVGGREVVGRSSIRTTFEGLCAPGDRITLQTLAVTASLPDVAMLHGAWEIESPTASGAARRGVSTEVVRRQPDGTWLFVIDNPNTPSRRRPISRSGTRTPLTVRQAGRDDIPMLHRVRMAVRENRLTSTALTENDYVLAMESPSRTLLIEADGAVVAFTAANASNGNVWALFVDPAHEGRGYGRLLHDAIVAWLRDQGVTRAWLTTTPGTRAHRFYVAAGWTLSGPAPGGEMRYELSCSPI